jgi:hypothetical protein
MHQLYNILEIIQETHKQCDAKHFFKIFFVLFTCKIWFNSYKKYKLLSENFSSCIQLARSNAIVVGYAKYFFKNSSHGYNFARFNPTIEGDAIYIFIYINYLQDLVQQL